jgi:DNA replication and repair protein RecF
LRKQIRKTLILEDIRVEQYRNYGLTSLTFCTGINCFAGRNGSGKTNLLDAIYYLCSGKSYFNAQEQQLIRHEESYFTLRGTFDLHEKKEQVMCALVKGRRKVIKRNDIPYSRILDHYGQFPVVVVAPVDMELISGGSEERRKWLDSAIAMTDHDYLLSLVTYEKLLAQRNATLRKMAQEGGNSQLIEVYDQMIVPHGEEIVRKRETFMEVFNPVFNELHQTLSNGYEDASIGYESRVRGNSFAQLLRQSLRKDIVLERTTIGPHKDDLEFRISEFPLKKFGSQGQQKSFLLALKLAQYQLIRHVKQTEPLLLLDDISERLDEERLKFLFGLLSGAGQVFVTDASPGRVSQLLEGNPSERRFFVVENGSVIDSYQ